MNSILILLYNQILNYCFSHFEDDEIDKCKHYFNHTFSIFAAVGFTTALIHAYIIFCYNFRVNEEKEPVQTLICSLSVLDFFVSVCFCGQPLMHLTLLKPWEELNTQQCLTLRLVATFDRNLAFSSVMLLATNRYYSICRYKTYKRTFSKTRIKYYLLTIFAFGSIKTIILSTCACWFKIKPASYFVPELVFSSAFYLTGTVLLVVMYMHICREMLRRINRSRELNKIRVNVDDSYGSFSSVTTTYDNLFIDDLKVDRSYLLTISISIAITIPFLLLHHALISVAHFRAWRVHTHLHDTKIVISEINEDDDVVIFQALLNPVVFYFTNEDFKIRLKRPIRQLLNNGDCMLKLMKRVKVERIGSSCDRDT